MRKFLTPDDIASAIRLARGPSFSGAFLIVEGKSSDLKVYTRFIDHDSCRVIPAHSKENAIRVLQILETENFKGVLGIVDADFYRLEDNKPGVPNMFITDTHDLETMILRSPALEKLLSEYGSPEKIEGFADRTGKDIRTILLESGALIGYLRWISQRENLLLKFEGITFSRFIKNNLTANVSELIREVKNKSGRHNLDSEDLEKSIEELANVKHDLWDVCCGHDIVCILSFGLRRVLGTNNPKEVESKVLEKDLRLAYEATYFFDTQLYRSLKEWERTNKAFRIFPTV